MSKRDRDEIKIYEYIIYRYISILKGMRYDTKKYGSYGQSPLFNDDAKSPYYGLISNSVVEVVSNLLKIYKLTHLLPNRNKLSRRKFLDAGCGLGNILIAAQAIGFDAHGIEFDSKTFKLANKLFNGAAGVTPTIEKANMITYDKYDKFDIIYYYVPIRNREIMTKAAINIMNSMKSGAIIVPYGFTGIFVDDKRFKRIKGIFGFIKK